MRDRNDVEDKSWQRIVELIRSADRVPDAPDCRPAVMARISPRSSNVRWVWACACAVTVVAAVAVGVRVLSPRPSRPQVTAKAVKKQAPVRQEVAKGPAPRREITVPTVDMDPRAQHVAAYTPPMHRHVMPVQRKPVVQPEPVQKQANARPEPASVTARAPAPQVADADRPVALTIVTWPSKASQSQTSYDYGYIDRDAATGQTTECRVKRSGDSVDIYIESKPEGKEPPVKGSVDYETKHRV